MIRRTLLVVGACVGLIGGSAILAPIVGGPEVIGAAFAKGGEGNGGGHGNGNGGGHGGGNGQGNSGSSHGNSAGHGKSSATKGKTDVSHTHALAEAADDDNEYGKLGALNAAHASANARAHASPNSAVGKIAAYDRSREEALAMTDPVAREEALDAAVARLEDDFGRTLTDAQIDRVNALLDARR